MTTIILDREAKKLYADMRCSHNLMDDPDFVVPCDTTDKVHYGRDCFIAGSGNLNHILQFLSDHLNEIIPRPIPISSSASSNRSTVWMVSPSGNVTAYQSYLSKGLFSNKVRWMNIPIDNTKRFSVIGSGSKYAEAVLYATGNVDKAMKAAAAFDPYTSFMYKETDITEVAS